MGGKVKKQLDRKLGFPFRIRGQTPISENMGPHV